jgi:sec-independent protein translocase protein TatA
MNIELNSNFAFLPNLNGFEIVAILFVVLLLFGAKRLPELSRSMGKSIREFKKATSDVEKEINSSIENEPIKNQKLEKTKESDPLKN